MKGFLTNQSPTDFWRFITTKTDSPKTPQAIIFFGPDGSGKTTQANMLLEELKRRDFKTHRLWLRSLHTFAFIISKIAMKLLKLKDVYEFRAKYSHRQPFREFWYGIEFLSILPLVILRMYMPIMQGKTIVAERYVVDWIVSLSYVTRNERLLDGGISHQVLKFIPKNSLLIYVDASFDAITARGRNDDSVDFIEFQRKSYTKFARRLGATTIDTSDKSLNEVHQLILDLALGNSAHQREH